MLGFKKRSKKGALELSIGTIVILVLAMSMLILGVILIKNIFEGTSGIADMTIDQVKTRVSELFVGDKKIVVFPASKQLEIKQTEIDGFGIGIKNLIEGSTKDVVFSYETIVSDVGRCGVTKEQAITWITIGKSEINLIAAPGEEIVARVLFNIPVGSPLCTLRYRVNVKADDRAYGSDFFDITIKPA